jgi:hypothetical protein
MIQLGARVLIAFVVLIAMTSVGFGSSDCKTPEMRRGTESSGGGGTILLNSTGGTLIDLLWIAPEFRETVFDTASFVPAATQVTLAPTDRLTPLEADPALRQAQVVLTRWGLVHYDPVTTPTLSSGLFFPTIWSFTDEALCGTPSKSFKPTEGSLKLGAYYLKNNFEIKIYRPLWNKMGLKSQAGLILHENIRYMQIGLERNFDEETLEQVTALLVMCEPTTTIARYIDFLLVNRKKSAESVFGSFEQIAKQCQPNVE